MLAESKQHVPAEWAASADVLERRAARVAPRPGNEYATWGGRTLRLITLEARGDRGLIDYSAHYIDTRTGSAHRCALDIFCAVIDGA